MAYLVTCNTKHHTLGEVLEIGSVSSVRPSTDEPVRKTRHCSKGGGARTATEIHAAETLAASITEYMR